MRETSEQEGQVQARTTNERTYPIDDCKLGKGGNSSATDLIEDCASLKGRRERALGKGTHRKESDGALPAGNSSATDL